MTSYKVNPSSTTVEAVDREDFPMVVKFKAKVSGDSQKAMRTVGATMEQYAQQLSGATHGVANSADVSTAHPALNSYP